MNLDDEFTKLIREFGAENNEIFGAYVSTHFDKVMSIVERAKREDDENES